MPRTPAHVVNKRQMAAAIRVLDAAVNDDTAPLYLRVQSARSLLAQPKPKPKPEPPDDGEFPRGGAPQTIIQVDGQEFVQIGNGAKVIILPYNKRKFIAQDRERQRLEQLAELPLADGNEPLTAANAPNMVPAVPAPNKPATKRELARRIRERRKAAREAD